MTLVEGNTQPKWSEFPTSPHTATLFASSDLFPGLSFGQTQKSKATGPVDVICKDQPAGAESEAEKGEECVWRSEQQEDIRYEGHAV